MSQGNLREPLIYLTGGIRFSIEGEGQSSTSSIIGGTQGVTRLPSHAP